MLDPSLTQLLEDGQAYAPSYGGGLSNHLPMTLVALDRLGADHAALAAHALRYTKRLEPALKSEVRIDDAQFERFLGDWSAHDAYRSYFAAGIARDGIDATLAEWLPRLAPGIAAAGFHGLIRLAYGIDAKSACEQAAGLAYLASGFTQLVDNSTSISEQHEPVDDALARLRTAFSGRKIESGLIIEELRLATEEPGFFTNLRIPDLNSAASRFDLVRAAVRVYLANANFNSLHLVTGTHALEVVLDHLPAAQHAAVLGHFWVAFCAAYVGIGAPPPAKVDSKGDGDWQPMVAVALSTPNDHTIKMVHTCKVQFLRHQDAAYFAAARRVTGLA